MSNIEFKRVACTALWLLMGAVAQAQEVGRGVLYVGTGPAKTADSGESTKTPWVLGYLHQSNTQPAVVGFDVAAEGTLLDSTWGQVDAVKQSNSFNLLIGRQLVGNEESRLDAALVLGVRKRTVSCPASYLGFQCYADSKPKSSYGGNFGMLLAWSYQRVALGVRATGESRQMVLGLRF